MKTHSEELVTKNIPETGLGFIEACCVAQTQFDAWMEECDEQTLKVFFTRLVAMRTQLNELVREAGRIVHSK